MTTTLQPIIILAAQDNARWQLHAYPVKEKFKSAPYWPSLDPTVEFEVITDQRIELAFEMPAPENPSRALLEKYWRAEVFGWKQPLSWVLVLAQVRFRGDTMQVETRDVVGNRTMPEELELNSRDPKNRALLLRLTPLVVGPNGEIEHLAQAEGLEP